MATAAAIPKTILITLPTATSVSSIQCQQQQQAKIGQKRAFSILSSPPQLTVINKSASPPAMTANPSWLPATVQRPYKLEALDDDYDYGDTLSGDGDSDQGQYGLDPDQPPRKRERLTHLTAEEKMFRRKMKNRIAAQTARDRKKALMIDLEDTVRRLEEENDHLLVENSRLRQEHSSLAEENDKLKKMLTEKKKVGQDHDQTETRSSLAFGPAESISVPLPKEQVKPDRALTWLLTSALIQLCSNFCANSLVKEEKEVLEKLEELKENNSLTLDEVINRCPPEALYKLRSIIRSCKTSMTKPP